MAACEPIDPHVRLAIAQWPEDAPRGAVSTFCAEHGISRKSFYELRGRARVDGPAAVLEPRTRRPTTSPSRLTEEVKEQALKVGAALEASGLDHGPISVHKMRAMGLDLVPSTASLARIFRRAGVARLEPKKKPRSAWRRFVYPSRRGFLGQHAAHVSSLGVEAITGKPYKPTIQGKNERFHQTLFRYLDTQPLASTPAEMQAHVDAFDHIYNTQRPHQGLPGRVTPQTAWEATARAEAPRPKPEQPFFVQAAARRFRPVPLPKDLPAGTSLRKLTSAGSFMLAGVDDMVGGQYGFQQVLVIVDGDKSPSPTSKARSSSSTVDPHPGTTYVGNGRPRGPRAKDPRPSPKS